MNFATGMMLGMASRGSGGGGDGFDLSCLTFKDLIKGIVITIVVFFPLYLLAIDSLMVKANKDMYGITYERNIAILSHGMSEKVEVGLKEANVNPYYSISIKTKHDGVVYFNREIRGKEYDSLIKYLSEGCRISYSSYGDPIIIYGWLFRMYHWRLRVIGY